MGAVDGIQIKVEKTRALFEPTPTEYLIKRLIEQMAQVPQFVTFFGPLIPDTTKEKGVNNPNMRWANYARPDWSFRNLPAISVYEGDPEEKTSANAWLNGTIKMQIPWPALKRSDPLENERLFKGAIQNFFESQFCDVLLDPYPTVNVATKVPGLNELGRMITWTPNVAGIIEGNEVPITLLSIKYRIDLRAWYRYLETIDRTKENPFQEILDTLTLVAGEYDGVTDNPDDIQAILPDNIPIGP